jgi:hypothetical protein
LHLENPFIGILNYSLVVAGASLTSAQKLKEMIEIWKAKTFTVGGENLLAPIVINWGGEKIYSK